MKIKNNLFRIEFFSLYYDFMNDHIRIEILPTCEFTLCKDVLGERRVGVCFSWIIFYQIFLVNIFYFNYCII